MKKRYLTKSRFKTAFECPTKLFYLDRKEYGNKNQENDFLKALAKGGYQVGALAKIHYGPGEDLESFEPEPAAERTRELLKRPEVTIFEATLVHNDLLVRVDVLRKRGTTIELFEVKAKSHDFENSDFFKRDKDTGEIEGIDGDWQSYLIDVAFQTHVARLALPDHDIQPHLVVVDKRRTASRDGIHQLFLIQNDEGEAAVKIREGVTKAEIGTPLICAAYVLPEVNWLIDREQYLSDDKGQNGVSFLALVKLLTHHRVTGDKYTPRPNKDCKNCEFRIGAGMKEKGLKSGFEECWSSVRKVQPSDFDRPLLFDLWNTRSIPKWLDQGKFFLSDLKPKDLPAKDASDPVSEDGLTSGQRQALQLKLAGGKTDYFDPAGFERRFCEFKWPFHFIDFETTMVAIPFNQGRRPYEQIAFQFSHHVLHKDGTITHEDQFISVDPGAFPNFEFVRKLQASLSKDNGTIFRFATHENTVLRQILRQLEAVDPAPPDLKELREFILSVTQPTQEEQKKGARPGVRNMVDLREIVLKFYMHPDMGGSNSIKAVMPAVLNSSPLLKEKYSQPIYGKSGEIRSLNLDGRVTWVNFGKDGRVLDPYKQLPPIMKDIDPSVFSEESRLFSDEYLKDGGAAMTAWARMQFTEMSPTEREAIVAALLRYCELDTLAMVWLMEEFQSRIAA